MAEEAKARTSKLPAVRTMMTMKIHRPIGTVDAKHISVMHCGCANSNVVCLCANYEQSEHLASWVTRFQYNPVEPCSWCCWCWCCWWTHGINELFKLWSFQSMSMLVVFSFLCLSPDIIIIIYMISALKRAKLPKYVNARCLFFSGYYHHKRA